MPNLIIIYFSGMRNALTQESPTEIKKSQTHRKMGTESHGSLWDSQVAA